jgi:hypothetical protein
VSFRQSGKWLGLAALLSGIGCVPGQFTINVSAAPNVNQSRPVYMVVRTLDSKAYLSQTYDEVVAKVITPDESIIHTGVIYPGGAQHVNVKVPQSLPVAVSFLFTSPDGAWQTLLDAIVPGTVDIRLEGSRIREGVSTSSQAPPPAPPSAGPPVPGA